VKLKNQALGAGRRRVFRKVTTSIINAKEKKEMKNQRSTKMGKKTLSGKLLASFIAIASILLLMGCSLPVQLPDSQNMGTQALDVNRSVGKSIWNSTSDFAADQSWTYGYYQSGASNFIEYKTQTITNLYGDLNLVTPVIYKNWIAYPWMGIDQISIHPSLTKLGVIRWTAPHAGTYKGSARFYEGNGHPSGSGNMGAFVSVKSNALCTNQRTNGGLTVTIPEVYLYAGEVIDVAVGPGPYGHYFGDTPVDMTITETSLPPVPISMIRVPGGTIHQVGDRAYSEFNNSVSAFCMSKYEVFYHVWKRIYDWAIANGYRFQNPGSMGSGINPDVIDLFVGVYPASTEYEPVTEVSWRDVIVWCNALSEYSGKTPCYTYNGGIVKDSTNANWERTTYWMDWLDYQVDCNWSANGYRLPTMGEWECVARYIDGINWTNGIWPSGATTNTENEFHAVAVYGYDMTRNSYTINDVFKTAVGETKKGNALGIYDMSGNVSEWCWDLFDYYPVTDKTDYRGPAEPNIEHGFYERMCPGGSWNYHLKGSGYPDALLPSEKNNYTGFRIAFK
jgi:sulfatase modifying factor 1